MPRLVASFGQAVSREDLLAAWPSDEEVTPNALRIQILRLRRAAAAAGPGGARAAALRLPAGARGVVTQALSACRRPGPGWTGRGRDAGVPRLVVQPLQRFLQTEAAGGALLLVAAVVALVWANSSWSGT